ncbi:hypothetical protein ACFYPT_42175, partial [Streptomyces sp. NPDC005529]|uniref:hypothetical protein n=1 Tax=unclassified Streptomyces TaxID=2593676 RepID=UPI0033A32E51
DQEQSRHSAKKQEATDSRPKPVPRSGTATIEKARILGLQPEEQVKSVWPVELGREETRRGLQDVVRLYLPR